MEKYIIMKKVNKFKLLAAGLIDRSCFLAVRIRFLYIHDMVGNFMDSWIGIYADNGSDIQRF